MAYTTRSSPILLRFILRRKSNSTLTAAASPMKADDDDARNKTTITGNVNLNKIFLIDFIFLKGYFLMNLKYPATKIITKIKSIR